jgi:uncharacterized membrane protein
MACVNHADRESIARCVTCGAELCLECSREIGGRYFCVAHATAAPAPPASTAVAAPVNVAPVVAQAPTPAPGVPPATAPAAAEPSKENPGLLVLLYILAAVPVVGLIVPAVVLSGEARKSRTMRFHAWQALFLAITYCVLLVATSIIAWIIGHGMGRILSHLLWRIVPAGWLVLCILLGISAYNKKEVSIPFITQLATDQADKMPA